jgi:hypothetical protein
VCFFAAKNNKETLLSLKLSSFRCRHCVLISAISGVKSAILFLEFADENLPKVPKKKKRFFERIRVDKSSIFQNSNLCLEHQLDLSLL